MHDLTGDPVGIAALLIFVAAYLVVILEERLYLRKSIPVLVAAGIIWVLIGIAYAQLGETERVAEAVRRNLLEFAELLLFLIVAMTYVNTMSERGVFDSLRGWLTARQLSFRSLFWVTGALAFVISPVADNLTTALVMGAVVLALGADNPRFVTPACINIVVAANAGGAPSPFGDITTLMVWQAGIVPFSHFFNLFLPALVNWLIPASIMSFTVGNTRPAPQAAGTRLETGALTVVLLFLGTIAGTVSLHSYLHLPPALGMMLGLGMLKLYSYGSNLWWHGRPLTIDELDDVFARPSFVAASDAAEDLEEPEPPEDSGRPDREQRSGNRASALDSATPRRPLHIFRILERLEWDTLMFFYGVIIGLGGLGTLGYLAVTSRLLYDGLGATAANVLVGIVSAVVDNVPVMFAVLSMDLSMSEGQWLLVTLTAGVGGSLLSVGSAAGVALMGQSRGLYTFMSHFRWSWAIALGYAASIGTHVLVNGHLF